MSIFGNNSSGTNEVSPNTFQTPAAGIGKPKTTVSSKGRTINENIEKSSSMFEGKAKSLQALWFNLPTEIKDFVKKATEIPMTGKYGFMAAMDKARSNYEQIVYMASRYGSEGDQKAALKLYEEANKNITAANNPKSNTKRIKLEEKLGRRYDREINSNGDGFDSSSTKPKWASGISDAYWGL